jgi:hypothetical protein
MSVPFLPSFFPATVRGLKSPCSQVPWLEFFPSSHPGVSFTHSAQLVPRTFRTSSFNNNICLNEVFRAFLSGVFSGFRELYMEITCLCCGRCEVPDTIGCEKIAQDIVFGTVGPPLAFGGTLYSVF